MADIRIKDLATTATTTASDDFMALDGATNGTRKLSAATPAFLTSVTTPSLTSPASTNLTLTSGLVGTNRVNFPDTLSASSATAGAVTIGNGTAATNVAIGGGKVNIGDTTAGSSGAGALVVAGGLATGAASYFGGNVTTTGNLTLSDSDARIIGGTAAGRVIFGNANTSAYVIAYGISHATFPGYVITVAAAGSAQTTLTNTGLAVTGTLSSTGAATFTGAVTATGNLTASGTSNLFSGASAISNARNLFRGAAGSAAVYLSDADTPGATSPSLWFASSTDGMFLRNASGVLQVIDETTPAAGDGSVRFQVSNAGAVRMNAYGAGTATFDSSGNITSVSDARLKNITGTFTKGLAEIVKLTPKLYTWKPETGLVTDDINATLIAQDLIAAGLSEAVTTYRTVPVMEDDVQSAEDIAAGKPVTQHPKLDADGKAVTQRVDANYSVSDRTVIAALVNAVKELKAEIDALKAK